jgi:hypothetical protein
MYRVRDLTTGRTVGICSTEFQAAQMACDLDVHNYVVENTAQVPAPPAPMTFLDEINQLIMLTAPSGQFLLDELFIIGEDDNGEPEFTFREGEVATDQSDPA